MPYDEKLREQWVRANYPSNMGSACVVPPPPPNPRRVYHLTAAEFAISDIVYGRLKISRFSDLNDPFELMALALDGGVARRVISRIQGGIRSPNRIAMLQCELD